MTASKTNNGWNAIPVLNYAIFLYNLDPTGNRDTIIELMMEFEQCWLKRKQNSEEFDENVMKVSTRLASALNVANHMAWVKEADERNRIEAKPEINIGASTSTNE